MKKIILFGGRALEGEITVSGSKNAALPIIFSCILAKGVSEINNLPNIGDVNVALDILASLGAEIRREHNSAFIDTTHLRYRVPSVESVSRIRASTYLIGTMLSRFGRCRILPFGGCNFSKRPIDMHIDACVSLGGVVVDDEITAQRLTGGRVVFDKPSVGATVNAIMLAVSAEGDSTIIGAAREPHIDALIEFLLSCGADIKRINNIIHIKGRELHGGKITVIGDMIEAGSYLCAGLITGGVVTVNNCPVSDMDSIFNFFRELGAKVLLTDNRATVYGSEKFNTCMLTAEPYPGFPTDLQPIAAVVLSRGTGGKITDNVWQSRFGYLRSLSRFGVEYNLKDCGAEIYASTLRCASATAPDLRGGMACILAGLAAKGRSEISSADTVLRGYEDLINKLNGLGAELIIKNI